MVAADGSHVATVTALRSPHPFVVVRAAGSTSLLGLELGYSAETGADGHADCRGVPPAVDKGVSATGDLSAEAKVGSSVEAVVRLAADLVGAAQEVSVSGAPGASVEGAELVTRKRRAASGVTDRPASLIR